MAHRSGGGSKVRKWRKYSVNGFELGQLNGEAVVTWREAGKRRRFRLGVHTELEGRAALDRWARRQGAIALRQPKNVGELWSEYITDRTKDGKVIANMHYHWKALGPRFAKLSPDDIDADVCRDYAKVRKADGVSAGTVWTELTQLRTALNWAVKRKKIGQTYFVWVPLKPASDGVALTEAECWKLIEACQTPHVKLFVILAITTAGRTAAILELTWDRIDFDTGIIDLKAPKQVDWLEKKVQKGRAVVVMNDLAREALLEAKAGALTEYVIEWDAQPVKCIRKGFMTAARRAGVDATPHDLRHTAASMMEEAGIDMQIISRFLAHKDQRTTSTIYAKPRPDHLRPAAEVVNFRRRG
jgi:integrase